MIEVLVVEDSPVIRDWLVYILESDPSIRVSDTAADGAEALASVGRRRPDVILMDLHMPGVDGFEATRRIMATDPVPIVVCTASTLYSEVGTAMRALEAGALVVLRKPTGLGDPEAGAECAALVSTVKLMSEVRVVRRWRSQPSGAQAPPRPEPTRRGPIENRVALVAIGASTGGPPVIRRILAALPLAFPAPILVVQHISPGFTAGLAEWLGSASGLPVHVAAGGGVPLPGHVYLAPDDRHLRIGPGGELQTTADEPQGGLRPAVGVLFRSVAERLGRRAAGVLLSGMGRDGAAELRLMADRGALTVAQDEASCVVFGMPGEAIRLGGAQHVLPPPQIAALLGAACQDGVRDQR